jgi:hypothetical protein
MTEQQHTELVREFTAKSPKHPYPALDVDAMFAEIVRLRARTATLTEATQAFTAWLASESTGPDYRGTYRDTPTGEQIWRAWYDNNLHLCAEALRLGRNALENT